MLLPVILQIWNSIRYYTKMAAEITRLRVLWEITGTYQFRQMRHTIKMHLHRSDRKKVAAIAPRRARKTLSLSWKQ